MSKVYFAVNNLGDPFAIKLLNVDLAEHETIRKRFRNEMEALKSLRDLEQVCQIKDFYEDGKQMAIVMEHLTGVNLLSHIRREGALSPAQLIDWMQQLLPPFAICHARKIVHRDVKPSNFFLTTSGKLKILDFGIAKALDQTEAQFNSMALGLTSFQEVLGSPMYMSPEQVRGLQEIDHRTDIYSLGVMIYTLLVGHNPYEGLSTRSNYDIQESIVKKTLPQLEGQLAVFNPIIQKATQKEPIDRHQSIQDLLDDLNRITVSSTSQPVQQATNEPDTIILNKPVRLTTPLTTREDANADISIDHPIARTPAPVSEVSVKPTPTAPVSRVTAKKATASSVQEPLPISQAVPSTSPKPATGPLAIKQIIIGLGLLISLVIAVLIYKNRESPTANTTVMVDRNDYQVTDPAQPNHSAALPHPTSESKRLPDRAVPNNKPIPTSPAANALPSWKAARILIRLDQFPHDKHAVYFAAARRAFAELVTLPGNAQTIDSLYTMCLTKATHEKLTYQRTSSLPAKEDAIEWYQTAYMLKSDPYLLEQIKQLKTVVGNGPVKPAKKVKKRVTNDQNVEFYIIPAPK
ncbi:protein kinase [Spirosoma sp. HMF3257]|uniref:Protein kinase domain-containing protein n=1 Tax=Spirosoma telluris TaxID=2183553 RepID=A0A327NDJ2_9BACT|nr:protein kinase [Spirosoma telluris]RAI73351.1 hypothetical protein HMF3257_00895 [Spirosoma telluris]